MNDSWQTMQSRVNRFIHAPATEVALIVLIFASMGLVTTEVALDARSVSYPQLVLLDVLLTSIFAVELGLRYWVARSKDRFFRQYWIDILAIIPLLPIFGIFRLLRLLRLLRVGVLINRNLGRISSTLAVSFGAQLGVLLIVGLIVLVGALGIFLLEGKENSDFASLKDALWWSFFTLISVEPISGEAHTDGGRLLTLLILVGGLTLFAVFTGVVSAVMVQRLKTVMDIRPFELDELRNHILICGWNRSGHLIIEELQAEPELRHCPIVVVAEFTETPERELRNVDHSRLYFYDGDYTTIDVLESIGIAHASRAILLADATRPRSDQDRDARTVLAALTIEKLQPSIYTCAQLLDRKNNVQLHSAGVEDIIVSDEVASHLIATSTRNLGASAMLTELLTVRIGNQIYKISLPKTWADLTFWQVAQRLKQDCDAMPLAIERQVNGKRETLVNPAGSEPLWQTDRVIVMAPKAPRLNDGIKRRG